MRFEFALVVKPTLSQGEYAAFNIDEFSLYGSQLLDCLLTTITTAAVNIDCLLSAEFIEMTLEGVEGYAAHTRNVLFIIFGVV